MIDFGEFPPPPPEKTKLQRLYDEHTAAEAALVERRAKLSEAETALTVAEAAWEKAKVAEEKAREDVLRALGRPTVEPKVPVSAGDRRNA